MSFAHDGDEFLRQTAVVSLDARYPHLGTVRVVGRAVLQRVRSACEENAALEIARAREGTRSPIKKIARSPSKEIRIHFSNRILLSLSPVLAFYRVPSLL